MSDIYTPAGDLLGTLELIPLPESAIPLEAIVFIKAIDEEGVACWFTRYTENLGTMELVGVLDVGHQLAKEEALDGFLCEFPSDDGDF